MFFHCRLRSSIIRYMVTWILGEYGSVWFRAESHHAKLLAKCVGQHFGSTPTLVLLPFAAPSLGDMTVGNLSAKYLASLALVGLAWAQENNPYMLMLITWRRDRSQFYECLEIS